MRRLIVCCDGTWSTPHQEHDGVPVPTNVVRLYNAVAEEDPQGVDQLKYYHPGVGTEGNWWENVKGGAAGIGLSKNIMSGYRWLCAVYQPGDQMFLFGFSRGAYSVRSLAGMIGSCGLLDLSGLADDEIWPRVQAAYDGGYRKKNSRWGKNWKLHAPPKIHFLGVWDTVGAMGVPNDMAILNILDDRDKYAFHDTSLSKDTKHARHALALDETRASFMPALWTGVQRRRHVKQVWFSGAHSDVGGGYPEIGLSYCALKWMMDEANAQGLAFHKGMYDQVKPDFQDVLHDSRTGVYKQLRTQPRNIPLLVASAGKSVVHDSALKRCVDPPIAQAPYRPTAVLKAGDERVLPVYASSRWNEMGVYLEAGAKCKFTASGQWMDRNIKCGPGGTSDGNFYVGELVQLAGSLWGKVEGVFQKLMGNEEADFFGTKREESYPWFALVGAIANCGNPDSDGTPARHETFLIGEDCTYAPKKPGYLYCFANDAWHFYGNNRGSVMLTIKRL
ncbi:MAG: DUF2235 domain-containing protein [Planctomycetes bacterium]|nr:DUF2235 domain-containing protein [Planctomycetota bacterium]